MKLPNKLSQLIRVAIVDLEKCEADPRYAIDMSAWHKSDGQVCSVCLAGAVMAQRLNISPTVSIDPADTSCEPYLIALDSLRQGVIHDAFIDMGIPTDTDLEYKLEDIYASYDKLSNWELYVYEKNPKLFKQCMLEMADRLEQDGY